MGEELGGWVEKVLSRVPKMCISQVQANGFSAAIEVLRSTVS